MNFEISLVNPYKNRLLQNKIEFSAKNVANRDTNIFLQKFDLNEDNYNEYYNENINISPLVEQIEKNTSSDAFIICCYEDSGLDFLSLLAIAYSLVKWPKPTPFVGKNTIASFEMFCFSKFKES